MFSLGRAVARFKKSGHLRRLFDVVANTSRDLRLFKVAAIEVVVKVLAGESFAVKVRKEPENELLYVK